MTFDATLNPVVYEGGIPVFIDTERDSWNILRTQSTCQYVDAKSTHFWLPSLRAGLSK